MLADRGVAGPITAVVTVADYGGSTGRLRRELQDILKSGIAIDDGELDNEMRCAAMPVHDFSGQVVGAIGVSGGSVEEDHEVAEAGVAAF